MFFFKEISGLLADGVELNLTIRKSGDKMIISVLPKVNNLKDEAAKRIIPIVVSGTPEELESGFSAAISAPVQSATGLLTNMKEFEQSQEAATANSKGTKGKADAAKKKADDDKKKYDQLIKKAAQFEKDKKPLNAVACLKQALKFATTSEKHTTEFNIKKLEAKANENSLFGEMDTEDPIKDNYLDGPTTSNDNEIDDVDFEDAPAKDNDFNEGEE